MSEPIKRPLRSLFQLVTDRWTQPFWNAAAAHRLVAARCGACATFRMPPTPFCPQCQSQALDWVELSGDGEVYSYTVVWRALAPEADANVPFIVAVVTLDGTGGVRLIANIVDTTADGVRIGDRVRVVWDDHPDGVMTPCFRSI